MHFELQSAFRPAGSQPQAISSLLDGFAQGKKKQVLVGVTGSGKTFSIANVIAGLGAPALIMAHNKALAAQLYNEFRALFPQNRVEFFVSYYDYYQPESYIPQRDQYIEKDSHINPELDRMRLSATASLITRRDVIIVASVSCIYSVGDPTTYTRMMREFSIGEALDRDDFLGILVDLQYERNDYDLSPGRFRVRGDSVDLVPAYQKNILRFEFFGDQLESISEIRALKGELVRRHRYIQILPARHFVTPRETIEKVIPHIRTDLKSRLKELSGIEAHRLEQRTLYDMEMLQETGFCKGIENYSRYFDGRRAGDRPYCLLDYLPQDALLVIDESHQTLPQIKAMYRGDRSRKQNLVDYGFRLPSAYDNRPLTFSEFETLSERFRLIFLSATPGDYEQQRSQQTVEQIIRPTGLLDPEVLVRPSQGQMQHLLAEIQQTVKRGHRILVTTLTKRFSEELSEFFLEQGIKTRYLHSEIDTLDRTELIRQLRLGEFDVLVGINLLREGLDIPEVGLVAILDADKEGFLRDTRSLIQTIGRAARNSESRVILYADSITDSMKRAMDETERRRKLQAEHNQKHGIIPQTIIKAVEIKEALPIHKQARDLGSVEEAILTLQQEMEKAAERLDFETAILLREEIKRISKFAREAKI